MTQRVLRQYYGRISSFLPCSGREKRALLRNIQESVELYLGENPDATIHQIQAHFGTPEQIAASSLQELSLPDILRKLRIRKRILLVATVSIVICALVWSFTMIRAMSEAIKDINGYAEVRIVVDENS